MCFSIRYISSGTTSLKKHYSIKKIKRASDFNHVILNNQCYAQLYKYLYLSRILFFPPIFSLVSFFGAIYDFSPSVKSHKFCNNCCILFLVFLDLFSLCFGLFFHELMLRKFLYDAHFRGRGISVYLQDGNCSAFVVSERCLQQNRAQNTA